MAIQWNDNYATGVFSIDTQHKELFKQVNNLSGAMSQGKGKDEIGKIITFLGDYTVKHFGNEETLMDKNSYPKSASHKALHSTFLTAFQKLKGDFERNGASSGLVLDINTKVGDWLKNHILETDKQLGDHLNRKS